MGWDSEDLADDDDAHFLISVLAMKLAATSYPPISGLLDRRGLVVHSCKRVSACL